MEYSPILWPGIILKRVFATLERVGLRLKTLFLARIWHLDCGRNVVFKGRTIIRTYSRRGGGGIRIGDNVVFNSRVDKNLVGLTGPTIICAARGASIEIGNESGFSSVVLNARKSIRIGSNVNVGGNVRIFDHDFHPLEYEARRHPEDASKTRVGPVCVEDDVFIGTNAIILKGTRIGARSIVAAGSVVFGLDIPPDSMVKGNPAAVVKRKEKCV